MADLDFLLGILNANNKVDDDGFYRCIWLMFHTLYFSEHKEIEQPRQLSIFDFLEYED